MMAPEDLPTVSSVDMYHNATLDWAFLSKKECLKYGGKLVGNNCYFVPDITLMSFILFLGTYTSSMTLKKFKTSRYFPTTKGAGYHLDLFWVAILMVVCSFMALPWYVAATVISIAHIDSLKMETETSAPGEQPKFLGVREQRVTGTLVFILTGLSVFMAPILKFIPMPVLYGVFLYMGVASLNGVQSFSPFGYLLQNIRQFLAERTRRM
ncbi:PREDICTED: electrogenic sodium bicarbonate cotransporter 1-like [Propithecus coquereli]|uniref:electrogenic sodium bicarbonate cotransporter 1-like n=1 Tax=Propithecus coquereli TaxID=379532 RepID=UPI00063FB988|nr:PREDICTED: electrogenic sodium bicarbonate cotransporter 1-like [Propithecus coquereli]